MEVFLALGSNLGDRMEHLRRGLERLRSFVEFDRVSSVYESAPEGGAEEPDYLNLVLRGRTAWSPRELLEAVHQVERAEGRDRAHGPRTLDVDILFFGEAVVREPDLRIPHPRWRERPFVLLPLREIAPTWTDPESGEPAQHFLERLETDPGGIQRHAPPPVAAARESRCGTRSSGPVWVPVAGGSGAGYEVVVEPGALERLPALVDRAVGAERYAVVSDSHVAPLYGRRLAWELSTAGMPSHLFTFPAGEVNKTRESWIRLTDELLAAGFGRESAVVAVGGGVCGDLAAFVAATYMRGLPVVQVPTSLVAMIDASVGGKTAVDHPRGKNLVGAFHAPRLVVADPFVVGSLPRTERSQGLAEAAKHGAILDAGYLQEIDDAAAGLLNADPAALEPVVRRSVEIKAEVVGRDEREAGLRRILNFGHTLGHALEAASSYRLAHGSAVSIGMVWEARLGERRGTTEPGTADRLERSLKRLELPVRPPETGSVAELARFLKTDKKVRGGQVRFVLLERPGAVDAGEGWVHPVPWDEVEAVLEETMP